MINAVIFDLDGVIVSTDKYHYKAWKKIADELGVYFDETINNRLRGVSRMESLEIILERYSGPVLTSEDKVKLTDRKNEYYRELLAVMTTEDVSADVLNTLKEIKKRGYKIAIGSSSKNTKFILEKIGIIDMFDAISDGTNITKSKPDPEVFLKAADYINAKCEECLIVEDAEAGIDAGIAAGMKTAAIGEAVYCGKSDYELSIFSDLLLVL